MKFLPLRTKSDQNPYKTLIFLLQLCEEGKMLSGPIAVKIAVMPVQGYISNLTIIMSR